jgi:uncharacterized protein YutE (UPF0331/DUF86 family)
MLSELNRAILRRMVTEIALPSSFGLFWALIVWYQRGDPLTAISSFAAAFFLLYYIQGQVTRVGRSVRSERDADEFRQSFASIGQALEELRRPPATSGQSPLNPSLVRSERFESEARKILETGLFKTAASHAAIGFEAAARDIAQLLGVDARQNLTATVDNLAQYFKNQQLRDELRTLARIRNSLVHSQFQEIDKAQAERLIRGFKEGVDHLEAAAFT